jgi:uncharacterized membrane protein YedE/YeeE
MRRLASAALFGSMFGLGLGVSGMTQPGKVIGFLDLFGGHWDPSLALVMGGAIAVHMPLAWWWRRRMRTTPSTERPQPTETGQDDGPEGDVGTSRALFARVNPRLVVGAAIFGVGWGLGGYCPGPALVTLVGFSPGILVFVASMMMGMWLFHLLSGRDPADLPSSSRPPASVTALPWVRGSEKDTRKTEA